MRVLTLEYFDIQPMQKYHIYKINGSETSQALHSHNYYQICYVDWGEIEHWQEDEPVHLMYGDAFIVPPGFAHRVVFPDKKASMYSLSYEEDMFHPGFSYSNVYHFMNALKLDTMNEKRIDIRMKVVLNESQRFIVKSLLESLIKESDAGCPQELTSSASLIAATMCVLSQAYFQDESRQESLQNITHYNKSVGECIEYIDAAFSSPLTIDDLAHKFAISKTALRVIFAQLTGTTPKNYIAKKRVDHAALLVRNSDLTINEISRIVGYDDFSTFYRNFINIIGVSPSKYRNRTE